MVSHMKVIQDAPTGERQRQVLQDADREKHQEAGDIRTKEAKNQELLYAIEDSPPWYLCILFGFQVNAYRPIHCVF